ncbi:uncharacterized protein LOC143184642 [Calliopsis andreniformis]|uniref:uncharacterized protein LOC143184642 n=1 Tax=Calliopsis andreniformis TaxID=337506 RepID=UPI003FCD1C4D
MFHYVNCIRTKIENFQFVLHTNFQQHYSFTRRCHKTSHVTFCREIFNPRHLNRFVDIPLYNTSKLCRVTTVVKQQLFSKSIFSPISYYSTHSTKHSVIMTSKCFKGRNDHYNGVTVDSNEEACGSEEFTQRLTVSLQQWIKEKKRTIWFRVHLQHSEWIPILVKEEFKYHHAREEYVMLYRWLVKDQECNVPHYAHTILGVGAFVYNEKSNEVLVIKEKYVNRTAFWKLPGGYVEPGEDLETAIKREVLEETGIQANFKCLIGFRHVHEYAFGCSDIYIIVYMTPINSDIKKCTREISECQWMKIDEYIKNSEVNENNKIIARKMSEFLKHRMGLSLEHSVHPIVKKPVCIYSISKINDTETCSK